MAKDKVRQLPTAAENPVEQPPPDEIFASNFGKAMEAYDQIILVCAKGGYIVDFIARRDNRHEVRGLLEEALDEYDAMMDGIIVVRDSD